MTQLTVSKNTSTMEDLRDLLSTMQVVSGRVSVQHAALAAELKETNLPVDMASAAGLIRTLRDDKIRYHDQLAEAVIANHKRQDAYGTMLQAAGVDVIEGNCDQSAIAAILKLQGEVRRLKEDAIRDKHNHAAALHQLLIHQLAEDEGNAATEIPDGTTLEHSAIEAALVLHTASFPLHALNQEETAHYLRRRGWRQLAQHEWTETPDGKERMLMESAAKLQLSRDLTPFSHLLREKREDKPPERKTLTLGIGHSESRLGEHASLPSFTPSPLHISSGLADPPLVKVASANAAPFVPLAVAEKPPTPVAAKCDPASVEVAPAPKTTGPKIIGYTERGEPVMPGGWVRQD